MPVKGQAKMVVFVGVMALTAVLAAIPAGLTLHLLDINLQDSEKAMKTYNTAVYSYSFVAEGENSFYEQDELDGLSVPDTCKFSNLPDDREVLFYRPMPDRAAGETYNCHISEQFPPNMFFWNQKGEIESIIATKVES